MLDLPEGRMVHPGHAIEMAWMLMEAAHRRDDQPLLLGWTCTGRDDLHQWYERVHEYTFTHFPDPECGEWYGYLNRDGSRVWTAKANGWKGCFHLPRILYRGYCLLDKAVSIVDGDAV